jgi:pyruvate, water dikinase
MKPLAQRAEVVRSFGELSRADVAYAGGKGANLGELVGAGFPVPSGFVVGAPAYAAFCDDTGLRDEIERRLTGVDVDQTAELEGAAGEVRATIEAEKIPDWLADAIRRVYRELVDGNSEPHVAVRSSATGEDPESGSFAGMNETVLNTHGDEAVLEAVRHCWASLFDTRTIYYRAKQGFGQADTDLAVVIQRQVEPAGSGLMFTVDPASDEDGRLMIECAFGLGEAVVSGSVSPDRYLVDKEALTVLQREVNCKELTIEPSGDGGGTATRALTESEGGQPVLSDEEATRIATLGLGIEAHYGAPQDTEWTIDPNGEVWMLQSRPMAAGTGERTAAPEKRGRERVRGLGAAPGVAAGRVRIVTAIEEADRLADDEILVTHRTGPEWESLMGRAAAVVIDFGGMTCHAATFSRQLGIPCVVATGIATKVLQDDEIVIVDGAGVVGESLERPGGGE